MLRPRLPERGHVAERHRRVRAGRQMRACGLGNLGQRKRTRHSEEARIGHQLSSKINAISGNTSFNRSMTRSVRLNSAMANSAS